MEESRLEELTDHAKEMVSDSRTIQISTVVMLNAWRLYYCARAVLDNYVELDDGLVSDEEKEVVKNIIANSMNSEAMKPYKIEELVAVLAEICVPFLQEQEANISEEIDEEGNEKDDD